MIIIFNGLCNYGLVIAELLARFQIPCKLYTTSEISKEFLDLFFYFKSENIIVNDRKVLDRHLRKARLFININLGIIDSLGIKRLLFQIFFKKIPVINIPTGSDIAEIEIETRIRKILFLMLLRYGETYLPHYFHSVRIFFKYHLRRMFFSKHPYILQDKKKSILNQEIVFLHPSNLDWGITDNKSGRNSIKNNIVFIEAFIRASKYLSQQNIALKCLILDRGPDKDIARQIIHSKEAAHFFEWLPSTTSVGLAQYIAIADIVVDQFHIGIMGMISMESMAQAKPVMIYVDKDYWPLVYDEEPPVINCHSEEEIYHAILHWADQKKLQGLGEQAEKWVRQYHDVHRADFSEFILRVCLAAGLEWPRKDLRKKDL